MSTAKQFGVELTNPNSELPEPMQNGHVWHDEINKLAALDALEAARIAQENNLGKLAEIYKQKASAIRALDVSERKLEEIGRPFETKQRPLHFDYLPGDLSQIDIDVSWNNEGQCVKKSWFFRDANAVTVPIPLDVLLVLDAIRRHGIAPERLWVEELRQIIGTCSVGQRPHPLRRLRSLGRADRLVEMRVRCNMLGKPVSTTGRVSG